MALCDWALRAGVRETEMRLWFKKMQTTPKSVFLTLNSLPSPNSTLRQSPPQHPACLWAGPQAESFLYSARSLTPPSRVGQHTLTADRRAISERRSSHVSTF